MAAVGGADAPRGPAFMSRHAWEVPRTSPDDSEFHVGEEVYYMTYELGGGTDFVQGTIMSTPFRQQPVRVAGMIPRQGVMNGYTVRFIDPTSGERTT